MIDDPNRPGQKKHLKDWEVWTPQGWHFTGQGHVAVCFSMAEAKEMKQAPMDPCDDDCDCWLDNEHPNDDPFANAQLREYEKRFPDPTKKPLIRNVR